MAKVEEKVKKVGATGSEFKCSDDRFGSDNMAKNLSFHPPWQVIGAAEKMAGNTSLGTACCAFPNQSLAVTISQEHRRFLYDVPKFMLTVSR